MKNFKQKDTIIPETNKSVDKMETQDPNNQGEQIEDVTMYGEMIPSLYNWINPANQMERTRELDDRIKKQQNKHFPK